MMSESTGVGQGHDTGPTSSRRIEANRRNAQLSTGPKTPEGKAKSSRNAITHGIFVKQFLNGAAPETVAQIEELAVGLREHYKPEGILEEIVVQKIVVETARYGRVLGFEHSIPDSNPPYLLHCLDGIARYSTSTSRALFHAIQELDRLQAARKALEKSAASMGADSVPSLTKMNEEQLTSQTASKLLSNRRMIKDPKDTVEAVGEVDAP